MALTENGGIAIAATLKSGWRAMLRIWKPGMLLYVGGQLPFLFINFFVIEQKGLGHRPTHEEVILFCTFYVLAFIWSNVLFLLFLRLFLVGRNAPIRLRQFLRYLAAYFWKGLQFAIIAIPCLLCFAVPAVLMGGAASFIVVTPIPDRLAAFGPLAFAVAVLFTVLYVILAIGVLIFLLLRLYPTFFAVAIGRRVRFRDAWREMRGHSLRIALACLAPTLLSMLLAALYFAACTPLRMQADGYVVPLAIKLALYALSLPVTAANFFVAGWTTGILADVYSNFWPLPRTAAQTGA